MDTFPIVDTGNAIAEDSGFAVISLIQGSDTACKVNLQIYTNKDLTTLEHGKYRDDIWQSSSDDEEQKDN